MIGFCVEPWAEVKNEILPVWTEHYDEVADADDKRRYELAPDWNKYQAAADRGSLQILVARDQGQIVGYLFAFVDTHLHYRDLLCCFVDIYWIKPTHRNQGLGVAMLRQLETVMRGRGVKKIAGASKDWLDASPIFHRCGWKTVERLHTKWIGG